jgi:hypothetical protein
MRSGINHIRRSLAPTKLYYKFDEVRRFLASERKIAMTSTFSLGKLRLLMRGMTTDKQHIYTDAKIDRYWSDFDAARMGSFNGAYTELLERKDLLHRILSRLEVGPSVLGVIRRGAFLAQQGTGEEVLERFLPRLDSVLLRPLEEPQPSAPRLLARIGTDFEFDGAPAELPDLLRMFEQQPWLVLESPTGLAPNGVIGYRNLVKIVMMRDRQTATPFCAFALQPVEPILPGQRYRLADLLTIAARIDIDSGITGRAATVLRGGFRQERYLFDIHPLTAEPISGRCVPGWEDAVGVGLRVMAGMPMINAGSFLLVRCAGSYRIIDASNSLDVAAAQLHRPLLEDARISDLHATYVARRSLPRTLETSANRTDPRPLSR